MYLVAMGQYLAVLGIPLPTVGTTPKSNLKFWQAGKQKPQG